MACRSLLQRVHSTSHRQALSGPASISASSIGNTILSRGFRPGSSAVGGAPYTLHAQCSGNNTILTLSLSSPKDLSWESSGAEKDRMGGRVVGRISSGMVGFKKGQRGTFEAGAGTTSAMMKLIDSIQNPGQESTDGSQSAKKNRNPAPQISELTVAFKGFGQGREALFAALTAAEGRTARMLLRRLQDVTPLKIGGGRPRKRRVL